MTNILVGISVIVLLVGTYYFVMHMEGIAEKRKKDHLEEFYKETFDEWEDDWWNEQDV